MQIQDAIHGYIELNEMEEQLLDTPEMQRLRRIRHLGFANLVYPSATHTRFEHSLGALYLADAFARSLEVDDDTRRTLRAAALLHDLGHGPFSHVTDYIFQEEGLRHEEFSRQKVRDAPVADILEDGGIDPGEVCRLIDGDGTLGSVIAGHIDVDRMDYLMRDAYYTGTAYGTVEADTILRAAALVDDRLVFDGQYVNALESLLTARYLMMPTVYLHRTAWIAQRMFIEAYHRYAEEAGIDAEELADMDDPEILSRLRASPAAEQMVRRIDDRELYKVAARLDPGHDPEAVREHVLERTGLDRDAVLVDVLDPGPSEPLDIPVVDGDTVTTLSAVSPLPAALDEALARRRELRVYAPEEHVEAVGDAAENLG